MHAYRVGASHTPSQSTHTRSHPSFSLSCVVSLQASIQIDDIEYNVFLALLEHLYTDHIDLTPDLALPLFAAADFLGVEHLKSLCEQCIEADLNFGNVCRALTVADSHGAASLRDTCVSFIVQHFHELHQTDGFQDLPRSLLALVHGGLAARLPQAEARHASARSDGVSVQAGERINSRNFFFTVGHMGKQVQI